MIVRMSILTILSTIGIRMMSPGPFVAMTLPRRKMTARSILVEDPDGRREKHDDQNNDDDDWIHI